MKHQIKFIVPCFLTIKKYSKVPPVNNSYWTIIVSEADNVNAATENRNLTAKTGNGHKRQQNRKNNSEQEKDKKPNKEQKKGKSVAILGDSMVKHLNGWEISKKIKNCKVYVRSFPGAKVQCMDDYKKPSVRDKPDHFIIRVGTNDLNSEVSPKSIAESIVDLAMSLKTESNDVSVSNIILRTDNSLLNQKGCEVNSHLKNLCEERNLYLIDNTKKFRSHHLNKGKLHLNRKGSKLLNDTFIRQLSHVLNRQENDISNISLEECRSHVSNVTQASDCISVLKALRSGNSNKLIFAHININSMRNKFESLSTQVKGNIDVLMGSETKIDNTFPVGNFVIDGFSTPYRLDRDSNDGGIMLYVREDIPSNLLATDKNSHIESFYVELNLRNEKWLINCSYNPNKSMIGNHLDALSTYLDLHSTTYEKILILGDFNVGIE